MLPSVGGLLSGHLLATFAVAAGLAALITRFPLLVGVLTTAGAAYLVWLGIGMLRRRPAAIAAADGLPDSWRHQLLRGFGVSGLNPKVLLLFLALLPQFAHASEPWPLPVQIVVLGLVHVTSCAVVYTLVAVGARTVLRARPGAALIVTRVSGIALLTIGVALVVDQLLR